MPPPFGSESPNPVGGATLGGRPTDDEDDGRTGGTGLRIVVGLSLGGLRGRWIVSELFDSTYPGKLWSPVIVGGLSSTSVGMSSEKPTPTFEKLIAGGRIGGTGTPERGALDRDDGAAFVAAARAMLRGCVARHASSAAIAVLKRLSRLRSSARSRNRSTAAGHFSPVTCSREGAVRSSFNETNTAAVVPSNGSRPESARNATAPTA